MDDQQFLDWFSELPLDNKVSAYKKLINEDGSFIDRNYESCLSKIYADFFGVLDKMVCAKYGPILSMMRLKSWWHVEYDKDGRTLRSEKKDTFFAISFSNDLNDCDESLELPLIIFYIALDEDRLNTVYIMTVFKQISEKLGECLRETFAKWSAAMADYYRNMNDLIHEDYSECLERKYPGYPMDNPERYFLTHEGFVLN